MNWLWGTSNTAYQVWSLIEYATTIPFLMVVAWLAGRLEKR